jgi:hypothetical protein
MKRPRCRQYEERTRPSAHRWAYTESLSHLPTVEEIIRWELFLWAIDQQKLGKICNTRKKPQFELKVVPSRWNGVGSWPSLYPIGENYSSVHMYVCIGDLAGTYARFTHAQLFLFATRCFTSSPKSLSAEI